MKKSRGIILGILLIIVLLFLGGESLFTYRTGHVATGTSVSYYRSMLSDKVNRGIFISAIVCSLFPILYLICGKHFKLKKLMIYLVIGLALFALLHSFLKGGADYHPVGFGRFITIFNTLLLFALGSFTLVGFLSVGSWITRKVTPFTQHRWQELLLTLGIGMIAFLGLVQILVGIGILYGVVSRILLFVLGFFIYWERATLKKRGEYVTTLLGGVKDYLEEHPFGLIAISVLLVISVMYFYYGMQNSFIPYSTAWDANHEYLYVPKIIAENAGILWGNTVGSTMPGMWHMFITYFFSLAGATNGLFGLGADTVAVAMNFWSAVLVLLLGVGIVCQVTELVQHSSSQGQEEQEASKQKSGQVGIVTGRSVLLLWLTSGMGAFLVMVDNKTDLGVMALSLLALLAGVIFLGILQQPHTSKKEILRYLIIAGIFFSFATLAKATAFVDVALFGILLIGLWISPRSALGIGMGLAGILRYMNILTSSFLISAENAKWLIIIGGVLLVVGIVICVMRKNKRQEFGTSIGYLLILGISFLVPLVIFKAPWLIRGQLATDTFSATQVVKGLFAQASGDIEAQNLIDEQVLESYEQVLDDSSSFAPTVTPPSRTDGQQDANSCLSVGAVYSEADLQEGLQEIKGSGLSEDVGRYIGFGWKEFSKKGNGVYRFLKLLFPTSDTCYGLNTDAKALCKESEAIDTFDIATLKQLYTQIGNSGSEASLLVKNALDAYDEKIGTSGETVNAQAFRDEIVALKQYYQAHSIKSDGEHVSIPYRYLIPLNITFNRSLQNLSSYYTDIGFARILLYIILIVTLPYALVKKDKMLTAISLTALLGRGMWWVIGGGILRYGTALISRTLLTVLAFANKLYEESKTASHPLANMVTSIIIGCILLGIFIQVFLNFFRISSQGATGPFVWYKGNVGEEVQFTDTMETKKKIVYRYGMGKVFNLQFPQYNAIIHALKERNNEDGVIIAGTYIQYFLDNQWNLKLDGMLTDFWVKTSDGNLCKTYRRLKDSNTKYLIIDPNIGTVGMGEGNETLFHRFFAKLSAVDGTLEEDGTLTTLVKLYKLGYITLFSTNNIGAYYAFTLSDNDLISAFGARDEEGLLLLRAKLIGIRYFSEEVNTLFSQIGNFFLQRVLAGQGIEEIALILGAEVDTQKMNEVVSAILQGNTARISELNATERTVFAQYRNLYQNFKNNSPQATELLQTLLMASIGSSSQVMAFELR